MLRAGVETYFSQATNPNHQFGRKLSLAQSSTLSYVHVDWEPRRFNFESPRSVPPSALLQSVAEEQQRLQQAQLLNNLSVTRHRILPSRFYMDSPGYLWWLDWNHWVNQAKTQIGGLVFVVWRFGLELGALYPTPNIVLFCFFLSEFWKARFPM